MPVGLAVRARELGVQVLTGRKVVGLSLSEAAATNDSSSSEQRHWTISTTRTVGAEACSSGRSQTGEVLVALPQRDASDSAQQPRGCGCEEEISARVVINCAGGRDGCVISARGDAMLPF